MNHTQEISLYRPVLLSIATRMLGSMQDAEDVVQDTFLRWLSVDKEKVANSKAYLIRSVTNNCLNHLNAFNQKKKEYMDTINNFELIGEDDFAGFDLENEISEALANVQKKLEPMEKAVYLLREVFNMEYDELTHIFDKKKENCRQMVSRAKEKLSAETTKFSIDMPNHKKLLESFTNACSFGDPEELIRTLNQEIEDRKTQVFPPKEYSDF